MEHAAKRGPNPFAREQAANSTGQSLQQVNKAQSSHSLNSDS